MFSPVSIYTHHQQEAKLVIKDDFDNNADDDDWMVWWWQPVASADVVAFAIAAIRVTSHLGHQGHDGSIYLRSEIS